MKNNKKMPKKYIKVLSNIFYELATLTRHVTEKNMLVSLCQMNKLG